MRVIFPFLVFLAILVVLFGVFRVGVWIGKGARSFKRNRELLIKLDNLLSDLLHIDNIETDDIITEKTKARIARLRMDTNREIKKANKYESA